MLRTPRISNTIPATPRYNRVENQTPSPANLALWQAADEGNAKAVREALVAGGNPNYFHQREAGHTALHRACTNGHTDAALVLLENTGVEEESPEDTTSPFATHIDCLSLVTKEAALHLAAARTDLVMMQHLVKVGAQINLGNGLGNTALHICCNSSSSNVMSCVRFLLANGASVNQRNKRGSVALHFAIYGLPNDRDSTELVAFLLRHRAETDAQNAEGTTPLMLAAQRGFVRITERLIDSGANVALLDQNNRTATYYSEFRGFSNITAVLNSVARTEIAPVRNEPRSMLDLMKE